MTTKWLWQGFLFVRASDVDEQLKDDFAAVFANNGSGQALADERKIFDDVVKLSVSGNLPAQAFGISVPLQTSMRSELQPIIAGLTNARWAVVSALSRGQWEAGELVLTNAPGITPNGQIVDFWDAVQFVTNEFGLQVIEEADPHP